MIVKPYSSVTLETTLTRHKFTIHAFTRKKMLVPTDY